MCLLPRDLYRACLDERSANYLNLLTRRSGLDKVVLRGLPVVLAR